MAAMFCLAMDGFGHVGVDFEHLLEVLQRGVEFGDAAGVMALVMKASPRV